MLEKITEDREVEYGYDFGVERRRLFLFRCKATGLKLYSKQIEKKMDNYHSLSRDMAAAIVMASDGPMPLEKDGCEHFKAGIFSMSEDSAAW